MPHLTVTYTEIHSNFEISGQYTHRSERQTGTAYSGRRVCGSCAYICSNAMHCWRLIQPAAFRGQCRRGCNKPWALSSPNFSVVKSEILIRHPLVWHIAVHRWFSSQPSRKMSCGTRELGSDIHVLLKHPWCPIIDRLANTVPYIVG